jgi:uncharacterized protein (TIGR01244 family)
MDLMRAAFAALSGGIFGAGLLLSGMTDTTKVQGWLDVFGNWDPTLAFVLGGAIIPMAIAWQVAARRQTALLGTPLPAAPSPDIDRALIIGSVLFGAGWALAGLCPGPAIASLTFGGWGGIVFLIAMLTGMLIAPAARRTLDRQANAGAPMDIRALTPTYAVSPQIALEDLPAIKAAGYTTIINNRPDAEIPPHLHTAHMQAAAQALGLTYIHNTVIGGAMTEANVEAQAKAIANASGPVFAYCASGNRSSVVWALANAGKMPTDDLIGLPARYGYQLEGLRGQIESLAAKG